MASGYNNHRKPPAANPRHRAIYEQLWNGLESAARHFHDRHVADDRYFSQLTALFCRRHRLERVEGINDL